MLQFAGPGVVIGEDEPDHGAAAAVDEESEEVREGHPVGADKGHDVAALVEAEQAEVEGPPALGTQGRPAPRPAHQGHRHDEVLHPHLLEDAHQAILAQVLPSLQERARGMPCAVCRVPSALFLWLSRLWAGGPAPNPDGYCLLGDVKDF